MSVFDSFAFFIFLVQNNAWRTIFVEMTSNTFKIRNFKPTFCKLKISGVTEPKFKKFLQGIESALWSLLCVDVLRPFQPFSSAYFYIFPATLNIIFNIRCAAGHKKHTHRVTVT